MRAKPNFIIAGLLILAAVFYLMVSSTQDTAHYFLTVEEVLTLDETASQRPVTVSGAVLGESITYDSALPRVTFTIVQVPGDPQEVEAQGGLAQVLHTAVQNPAAPRLTVVYDDIRPELLQHEAQAIIRGHRGADGRFYADEVLLKCPSRYEETLPEQTEG